MTGVAAPVFPAGDSIVTSYIQSERQLPVDDRAEPRFDEMVGQDRDIRPAWAELAAGLAEMGKPGLRRLRSQVERMLDNDGVTYIPIGGARTEPRPAGPAQRGDDEAAAVDVKPAPRERWRLDPVPLILDAPDWAELEAGLLQRATLLDLILTDIYGPRTLIRRGFIPPALIFGSDAYLRPAHGMRIPGSHQLFFYAADVFRTPEGAFTALGDRTQAPSGAGYAMADRRVVTRVSPEVFRRSAPHGLSGFFRTFRNALQSVAPRAAEDPRVVVLSPGTQSETAFDQAYVASMLGLPLVEAVDLTVREGRLWMRALGRYEPVDVVLRRVDAGYTDPLDLRSDSQLGVVGLLQAARRGSVTVVNTIGSGILENPGLLPYLPVLSEALLAEPLKLPSVSTFWCGEAVSLSHVLANFAEMVMRPTDGTGRSIIVGRLDAAEVADLRSRISAEPQRWVGQPFAPFSVAPVGTPEGLAARQVGQRLFAVADQSGYVAMPGGLGRVLPLDQQSERSHSMSEAKDIWVRSGQAALAGDRDSAPWLADTSALTSARSSATTSPRALEDLFWFGRYTERVEDLTRLLIATRDRIDEFRQRGAVPEADLVPVLLATVTHSSATYPGFVNGGVGVLPEMRSLVLDRYRMGTVAQSLAGLTEAANGVRDQLSGDTWLVLAGVDRALAELSRDQYDQGSMLQATHASILSGTLALSGLAAENMIRDHGWRLMDIGRRLERSLQLVSVLRWTLGRAQSPAVDSLLIESVLQFAESILTYRRRYRGRTQIGTVLELLLLDVGNPRSLAYQLQAMGADLKALPDASGTSLPERLLEEQVARVRRCNVTEFDQAGPEGERTDLLKFLGDTHEALSSLAEAIAAQHFWHPAKMRQLDRPIGQRRDRRPA